MKPKKLHPGFDDQNSVKSSKDDLNQTTNEENLTYNSEENSFEYDVKSDDPDYDHPDPYETAAKDGDDINSTYDEANPYDVNGEYDAKRSLETDVDKLGMHIDNGEIVELDPTDEILSRTAEDDRDDLDEEGYPKNDGDYLK
jgi:hypothetical protein